MWKQKCNNQRFIVHLITLHVNSLCYFSIPHMIYSSMFSKWSILLGSIGIRVCIQYDRLYIWNVSHLFNETSSLCFLQREFHSGFCNVRQKKKKKQQKKPITQYFIILTLSIFISRYNTIFFANLIAIILSIDVDQDTKFIVSSALILIGTAITVFALYIQKCYFIYSYDESYQSNHPKKTQSKK